MSTAPASRLTGVQWLICIIASIGFAFDIYELLMLPLIARPALQELGGFTPDKVEFKTWVTLLFYVPAVAGGVFAVLGFTQAFSSFGGLLVAVANGMAVSWSTGAPYELFAGVTFPGVQLPAIHLPEFLSFLGEIQNPHAPWRYTLMSGLIPAIPLI